MSPRGGFAPSDVVAFIEKGHDFAKDASGRLYVYRNGVYEPDGEDVIRAEDLAYFKKKRRINAWKKGEISDVLAMVQIPARRLWSEPPADVLNVKNGLLDIETRSLREHTPDHLSTLQIPVEYDPAAKCPAWDRFIGQVVPGCEELFWEGVAHAIVPDSPVQKMLLFYGKGGNGKSTLLRGVEELLGRNNVSNISLQELASDRFAIAELHGKLANICGDLPARPVSETATIKRLTGGDELTGQRKYGQPFKFRSYAKLFFSANELPKVNDNSDGFWDRLLIVPMEKRIRTTGAEVPQETLLAALREPQELSGALNRALEGQARLTKNKRFSEPPRSRELLDEMRGQLSPVKQFLRDETREDPAGRIEPGELLNCFNAWAKGKGYALKNASQFGKELAEAKPSLEKSRRGPRNAQKAFYEGIALNPAA